MRNLRSTAYGIIVGLAAIGTVALLYFDRLKSDHVFTAATFVMGISLGFLALSFRFAGGKESEESAIAGFGLVGAGSIAIAVAGVASFSFAFSDQNNAAVISCVVTVLLFIGFFFVTSFSDDALDAISKNKDYRSNHAQWARDLNDLATKAQSSSIRAAVRERAGACRFLARDTNEFAPLADDINECLSRISANVTSNEEQAALEAMSELDDLFKQRNDLLRQARSKV